MLDFRPRVQPRNYLSRREQRRLFAWVMGIGLMVIAIASLGKISQFLNSMSATVTERAPSIDTRFRPRPDNSGEPDSVSIVKDDEGVVLDNRDELLAGIRADLLTKVRDDTPWIRSAEIEAWLNVWGALAQSSEAELVRRSSGAVGFLELFQQPRAFRGQPVTIRGSARQATYIEAADNAEGIEGYYRVIVRPESGPPEPMFLYTLKLPADFPTGEAIRADVEATGVFFKRMVYPSKDNGDLRRAPVIMARNLKWFQPVAVEQSRGDSFGGVLVALVALGAVGLALVTYWASRVRIVNRAQLPSALPPIDDRGVVSIEESLGNLAENDR